MPTLRSPMRNGELQASSYKGHGGLFSAIEGIDSYVGEGRSRHFHTSPLPENGLNYLRLVRVPPPMIGPHCI